MKKIADVAELEKLFKLTENLEELVRKTPNHGKVREIKSLYFSEKSVKLRKECGSSFDAGWEKFREELDNILENYYRLTKGK